MLFPDVSAKPVSFKERIAGSRSENKKRSSPGRRHTPMRRAVNPSGGPRVLSPTKIHVSPCLCVCGGQLELLTDEITITEQQRVHSSSPLQIGSAHVAPPLALNVLTCCSLHQQSDSVAHPIMRDKRSAEEEDLTPCSPAPHSIYFCQIVADYHYQYHGIP